MTSPPPVAITRSPGHTLDLLRELVTRHLRLRYRRSLLGVLWSQLAPLGSLLVIVLVFTRFLPVGIEDYAVFVLVALLPWAWFALSLTEATESVVEGRDLVRSPGFPRVLLPIAAVAAHGVHLLLAVPLVLVATWVDTGRVPWTVVLLPVPVLVQGLVCMGPALATSAVNVRFRDVRHLVAMAMMPLFWATPVFYGLEQVPVEMRTWYRLNPLVGVVEAYRDVVVRGHVPDPVTLAWPTAVGIAMLAIGWRVFQRRSASFVGDL